MGASVRKAARGVTQMAFRITEDCLGCGACKRKCPWSAVVGEKKQKHLIEPTLCQECGTCWYTCPRAAVEDPEGYRRSLSERRRDPHACIDRESCVGCQNCLLNCEQGAIQYRNGLLSGYSEVDETRCVGCGSCLTLCMSGCITLE